MHLQPLCKHTSLVPPHKTASLLGLASLQSI